MSTSGGCHEYIGGYHEYIGGYYDACGDIMNTSEDVQDMTVFNINLKAFINFLPHMNHDIPPMYSWCPPMH